LFVFGFEDSRKVHDKYWEICQLIGCKHIIKLSTGIDISTLIQFLIISREIWVEILFPFTDVNHWNGDTKHEWSVETNK
jgi:hypothetical protein